jgi:hypothetical protein
MRSQVQVLAGPPTIIAGHSVVGAEPGAPAACLGRAGAARPSRRHAHRPLRVRPSQASGSTTTTHRGRAPSTGRQPRDRCGNLPPQTAPVPSRRRQPRALRTPAWPAWSLSRSSAVAAARTHPARPPATPHRPTCDLGSVVRPEACWAVDRAARRHGSPPGPRPVPAVTVAPPHQPGPNATARCGRRRTRPGGGGHQPAGYRTGGHQRAGCWTAGSRTTEPGGWTPHAGRGPAADAMAGVLAVSTTATTPDRWMPAGGSAGQTPSGPATTQDSSAERAPRGDTRSRGRA